jgi:hypothetical protein
MPWPLSLRISFLCICVAVFVLGALASLLNRRAA